MTEVHEPSPEVKAPYCCKIGCELDAEFEIADRHSNAAFEDQTHSCEAHIGCLLGYRAGEPRPIFLMWEIVPIAREGKK